MSVTPDPSANVAGNTATGVSETITDNGLAGATRLSICIPAWHDAASPLLSALAELPEHKACEVLIYDDGSADAEMTATITAHLEKFKGPAKLITASQNKGRSSARNRLIHHAEGNWLLMLDADMLPDDAEFLARYLDAISEQATPALIAGGFSLAQVTATKAQALHAAQSLRSECLNAAERKTDPGRFIFTSNILVHRQVLDDVSFDDKYHGWGWEDVDWGLRVARAFPIIHIDNPATHLGLDSTDTLLRKYGTSGPNFARLAHQHPDAVAGTPLYKAATSLRPLPGKFIIKSLCRGLARDRFGLIPMRLRLFALKLYRAAVYSETLS